MLELQSPAVYPQTRLFPAPCRPPVTPVSRLLVAETQKPPQKPPALAMDLWSVTGVALFRLLEVYPKVFPPRSVQGGLCCPFLSCVEAR